MVIDLQAQEILILDSLMAASSGWHSAIICNIRRWLHAELKSRGICNWDGCTWSERHVNVEKQGNGYDCGVFAVGFTRALVQGGLAAVDSFDASQCLQLRRDILETLLHPQDEGV